MISKIKWYGIGGGVRLIRDLIFSKLSFPTSRIIRYPWYIRGSKNIDFGTHLTTGVGLRIDAIDGYNTNRIKVKFGKRVQLNDYVHIAAINSIEIGDDVLIASKVFVSDHNHGSYSGIIHSNPRVAPQARVLYGNPVKIESNVWIGESVSIMPGVVIGEGSIIGAGSVVSKSIPPYSIAVGAPAKVIKVYDFEVDKWVACDH
ncbi:MAG: acetyltransferase [Pyrinomonadaceae bacterium]|nr:acetyltransferase [Sphingobacteriaceae bacterium]